ncbi:MAG: type I methionyl aminopeptidase [Planctomycetes bacterium]|nr:type I methionyl aminopeptidase [Planctomycetota bacterium]
MAVIYKDAWEIDIMRQAGRIAATTLQALVRMVAPGKTTGELDRVAEEMIRGAGARPTFKGYRGYRHTICASVNEEIVHGIPSDGRVLKEGNILSIDIGATYKGYVGDTAITVPVGRVSAGATKLMEACQGALEAGIAQMNPGKRLVDVSRAIEQYSTERGFSVVRNYCGHGVGRDMHEDPQVPNYVDPNLPYLSMELRPGLVLAIEPMLCEGTYRTRTLGDQWTVVTADGKLSAHFEHTIVVTQEGHEVLTSLKP